MNVQVMRRSAAVSWCHKAHENPTVMISISDPRMEYTSAPFRSKANNVRDILRLSFADADRPGPDVYGNMTDMGDMMTEEDAARVAKFVQRHRDTDIIVHCDAGISRSSGVAAAIMRYLTGNDDAIFDNGRYCPNMWCYRKTLQALNALDEEQKPKLVH